MSCPATCTLIVNPVSGSFSDSRLATALAYLVANGIAAEVRLTTGPGDATAIAGELCKAGGVPCLVAVGGDGTINEVINGIGEAQALLATLPFGTSNVLSRELGILNERDALERIVRCNTKPLALGIVEKEAERRFFFLMAGVGFDGAVVAGVRSREKRFLKQGAYILSALRCMAMWDSSAFKAMLDGRETEVHSLIACNSARYGGDFVLAAGASIFEPMLHVICIKNTTRRGILQMCVRVLNCKSVGSVQGEVIKAKRIDIFGEKAIQADGDFIGHAPVTIRAVMSRIQLIV